MKLHHLELTGFGPFRERQVIDFDAFDRDGIFLIAGRTGAGKSSILDGVCFALYGTVPRYESGREEAAQRPLQPEDPTEVRLEFTVGEHAMARHPSSRVPAPRTARRRAHHGADPRPSWRSSSATRWIGRAAKPREVGLLLDEVAGPEPPAVPAGHPAGAEQVLAVPARIGHGAPSHCCGPCSAAGATRSTPASWASAARPRSASSTARGGAGAHASGPSRAAHRRANELGGAEARRPI